MYFGGKFVHARKRLWKCICQDGPQWLSLGDWVSLGSFSVLLLLVPTFFSLLLFLQVFLLLPYEGRPMSMIYFCKKKNN